MISRPLPTSTSRACQLRNALFPNRMGCFMGGISSTHRANSSSMATTRSITWARRGAVKIKDCERI